MIGIDWCGWSIFKCIVRIYNNFLEWLGVVSLISARRPPFASSSSALTTLTHIHIHCTFLVRKTTMWRSHNRFLSTPHRSIRALSPTPPERLLRDRDSALQQTKSAKNIYKLRRGERGECDYHLERFDQSLGVQCRQLESMRILRFSIALRCWSIVSRLMHTMYWPL